MKVLQILPELNSGGVERGTLEVSRHLVSCGHQSLVVSHGGRLVPSLQNDGGIHIAMPVHKKRLGSLRQVGMLRELFHKEKPDIIHARSRVPAWLAWLAWRKLDQHNRPRFLTTFHGFYSVNFYSKIMTRGEKIIAVSNSVKEFILRNYPSVREEQIVVIHRGVDPRHFPCGFQPDPAWFATWRHDFPALQDKQLLLMPGRITRWKGQQDFLKLIAALRDSHPEIHGIIVGEVHPRKQEFLGELLKLAKSLGIDDRVTFLGHRDDLREWMAVSRIVYSLSRDPEAFGRVSLEAMAMGLPVIATNHGGVAEQLALMLPQGLVPQDNPQALLEKTRAFLLDPPVPAQVPDCFLLQSMLDSTIATYQSLLS